MPLPNLATWSERRRRATAVAVITVVVAAVAAVLVFVPGGRAQPAPATPVAASADQRTVAGPPGQPDPSFAVATTSSIAPPLTDPSRPATDPSRGPGRTNSAVDAPGAVPLPFTPEQLRGAADAAGQWAVAVGSNTFTADQTTRTRTLLAQLEDPQDLTLAKMATPSGADIAQMTARRLSTTAAGAVIDIPAVTRTSVLVDVQLTRTAHQAGAADLTVTNPYTVTVIAHPGGGWKISGMRGPDDAPPN